MNRANSSWGTAGDSLRVRRAKNVALWTVLFFVVKGVAWLLLGGAVLKACAK